MFDTKTFNEYVSKGDVICALVDKGQRSTRYKIGQEWELNLAEMQEAIDTIPIAKVQKEEDVYKFYYCKSEDDYYIGRRVDNFYYAKYDPEFKTFVWCMSRYLPWGEHVIDENTLWKEHTYSSEPIEIDFYDWIRGFIKKYIMR